MQVSKLMNSNVVSITPEESTTLAARLLNRHNIGSLPVCSLDGRLKGILTDRDIVLRCVATENDPDTTKVGDIMSRSVISVSPSDDVCEAARIMAEDQIRRLPVTQDGRIVGMLSLGDMAKRHEFDMEAAKALSDISSNIKRV